MAEDKVKENNEEQVEKGTSNTETAAEKLSEESFTAMSRSSASAAPESQNSTSQSKELVFTDPFKQSSATGDGPRLPAECAKSEAENDGFKRPENQEMSKEAAARMESVKKLSSWINDNFKFLDADKDGTLTEAETGAAIGDASKANGVNAPYLNALHNTIGTLSSELEGENSKGLTQKGLDALSNLADDKEFFRKSDRALQVRHLDDVRSFLDENRNGQVTHEETQNMLKRDDLTPQQKQALQDLKAYQDYRINKDYPNVQKDEKGNEMILRDFGGALGYTPREQMGNLSSYDIATYASTLERTADTIDYAMRHASDRLEAANKDPGRISQGTDGSCFFLAPLAGMKGHDPAVMDKMIKDNGDGTQTVTFPGDPTNPITVKTPTDTEMSGWANGKQAAIMEKAFSDYYVKNLASKVELSDSSLEQLKSPVPSARIQGGNTADAIRLLTGKDAETHTLSEKSDDELRALLQDAESKKKAIAADTAYQRIDPGLVMQHSYTARYDKATDSVVLENPVKPGRPNENTSRYPYEPFNPNGSAKDGKDDGIFRMSLADFKKNFNKINFVKD